MDLLKDKISTLYFKYLAAAFGSTLVISIYSLVDTIVIGQYEGPNGTAAVANMMPMWSIMFALGLLLGIGGSVLMAQRRGAGEEKAGNAYFSVALVLTLIICLIIFLIYNTIAPQLLYLFGGRGEVARLARIYMRPIAIASPLFILSQLLVPFIRNDGHPGITTVSVMAGGIFNIFGDIFFVFGLNMGIAGAGLATAIGQLLAFSILMCYMFGRKCRLRFDVTDLKKDFFKKSVNIVAIGASTFVVDIAIAVLGVLINNQIMAYSGASALAVYGVISSLSTTVQSFGYGIGESAQAIMSVNYGAGQKDRVIATRKIASVTALIVGTVCFLIGLFCPNLLICAYMTPTEEVLTIGCLAIRLYFIGLIFLVFNVTATYFFQAISKPSISMIISLARGIIFSAAMVIVLPMFLGITGIWLAIPVTETVVAGFIVYKYKTVNF